MKQLISVTAYAYLLQAFIAQDLIGDSGSGGITAGPASFSSSFDVSNKAEVEQPFFSLR